MTITFQPEVGPQVTETHECSCVDVDGKAWPTCNMCSGTGSCEFTRPEHCLHFSNERGAAVMRCLGIYNFHDSSIGRVAYEDLGDLAQRCLRVVNSPSKLMREAYDAYEAGRLHDMGISGEYLARRLKEFMALIKVTQELEVDLIWH